MSFLPDRSEVVIRNMLERHAEERPNKECVVFEDGERWTYAEALGQAYGAANKLTELGIRRGENVLVFLPNNQNFIRAWLGIAFLGAIIVPVNTAYKGEMLRYICKNSEAVAIVTSPDLAERVRALGLELAIIHCEVLAISPKDEMVLETPIEPWDIHAIMYTSGTTGPAKGVMMPYLQTLMLPYHEWTRMSSEDTALVDMPLFHNAALTLACSVWKVGGIAVIRGVFSASRYWDIIREFGVTYALIFSTMPEFLISRPARPDDADNPLRTVCCAPMVKDPAGFMARFGIEDLYTAFGMTETRMTFGTQGHITNPKSCGKIAPGVTARIVDEHDIPVVTGEPGELIIRTDRPWEMNAGYWKLPEETAKAWRNGWFHTGDLFVCDKDGNYFFVDRKKDAIRRRGENISSFEVEREVTAHPDVKEAATVAAPGAFGDDEVKVFVVIREGSRFDPADLIRFLIPRMPYFMIPRFVEVIPELPKTQTMRVRKYELRERGNSEATWDREAAGIAVNRNS
jgi:carnitine-CoA ligase